jgi:acetyltransferase-like isoleucine patch superfamily enzyme
MKPTFFNIRRIHLLSLISGIRLYYYKSLGLRPGKRCRIGKIICDWPNNVMMGDECVIRDGVRLGIGYGFKEDNTIKLGNHVFIGYGVEFNCTSSITVGNDVMIATGTRLVDVGHNFRRGEPMHSQPLVCSPIVIEDDVWIATNCVVLGGVVIGKGSIVGAGSVVNRSIPPHQVWAGVPARFIKNRE